MNKEDNNLKTKFLETEIKEKMTLLTLEDLDCFQIGVHSVDADDDISIKVLEAQQQVASINKPKKAVITGTVEICTIRPCAGILAEYTQKSGNSLPIYEVKKIVLESLNSRVFHMTCQCLDHTESGSATTKQKAKEIAAKKMLKHLERAGKLRLTTNLGL